MKETAMQEAIKEIAELWSSPSDTPTYTQIFNVLESKLEMEKQRAIEFAKHCLDKAKDLDIITAHSKAEQYYNETYKGK